MVHVAHGRLSVLEFNELQSEQYLIQKHQELSPFQIHVKFHN